MIVADASVLVDAISAAGPEGQAARRALRPHALAAPSHWMVEVFNAIRGLTLGNVLTARRAEAAIRRLPTLQVRSIPVGELLPHMWRLRHNLTGYDAAYVALAQTQGLTLVTTDRRMARGAVDHCRVELVGAGL